jgi:ADP-ribosylglycohydrolase
LWLDRIPFTQTYTAERVVYRNLVDGRAPAEAATYRNPYREWVGAQIRADAFGMVSPGAPRQAALWAMRDARLSHVTNGIYGAMWAAALVAAAFTAATAREALESSLLHIPPGSRLAEVVTDVLASRDAGLTWDEAADTAESKLGHYSWVHTLPNAAVVALALLWGEEDFSTVIGLTVQAGLDTDSNGATSGAVAGALFGAAGIPQHWTTPLDDQVRSAIRGFDGVHITDLARRTELLAASPH